MAGVRHFFSKVAGVTHANADGTDRQSIIPHCRVGEQLTLDTEEDNPADPNAVRVCRSNGEQIGYLSADLAEEVGRRSKRGYRYDVYIADITGGIWRKPTLGVNLLVIVAEPGVSDREAQEYGNQMKLGAELSGRAKTVSRNKSPSFPAGLAVVVATCTLVVGAFHVWYNADAFRQEAAPHTQQDGTSGRPANDQPSYTSHEPQRTGATTASRLQPANRRGDKGEDREQDDATTAKQASAKRTGEQPDTKVARPSGTSAASETTATTARATSESNEPDAGPQTTATPRLGLGVVSLDEVRDRLDDIKLPVRNGGVVVMQVLQDSPADKAGISEGDIIASIGGNSIANADEMGRRLATVKGTAKLRFTCWHEGSKGWVRTNRVVEVQGINGPEERNPANDSDPESLRQKAAAEKLRQAKQLLDAGRIEPGKKRLEDLHKQYPKTEAAKEAEQLLKDI